MEKVLQFQELWDPERGERRLELRFEELDRGPLNLHVVVLHGDHGCLEPIVDVTQKPSKQ